MLKVHIILLLLIFCISAACNKKEKANPLEDLPSGIWAPIWNDQTKEIGVRSISSDTTISYHIPLLVTDSNRISYYNSIHSQTEFQIQQNEEGNWQANLIGIGKVLLESNHNKDTLSCFFEDPQGVLQKVDFLLLLEKNKTKLTANELAEKLAETTWKTSSNQRIIFHDLSNLKHESTLSSHYINEVDTFNFIKGIGSFFFQQHKEFIFIRHHSIYWSINEKFLFKTINEANTELQLIPLIEGVYDSTLILQKELQDISYIDSLRKRHQIISDLNKNF